MGTYVVRRYWVPGIWKVICDVWNSDFFVGLWHCDMKLREIIANLLPEEQLMNIAARVTTAKALQMLLLSMWRMHSATGLGVCFDHDENMDAVLRWGTDRVTYRLRYLYSSSSRRNCRGETARCFMTETYTRYAMHEFCQWTGQLCYCHLCCSSAVLCYRSI